MRRLLCLAIVLALAATACTGGEVANGSPSPSVVPSPPTPSHAPSPHPTSIRTPRVFSAEGGGLAEQVVAPYVLGSDPFAAEHGLAVWESFPDRPAWSVVLAYLDQPADKVLGIRLQTADLTGDLHDDVRA